MTMIVIKPEDLNKVEEAYQKELRLAEKISIIQQTMMMSHYYIEKFEVDVSRFKAVLHALSNGRDVFLDEKFYLYIFEEKEDNREKELSDRIMQLHVQNLK